MHRSELNPIASVEPSRVRPAFRLAAAQTRVMTAAWTKTAIQLDGRLTEPVWQEAPPCELSLPQSLAREGSEIQEQGCARFLWNREFLYVGFELEDSDLVAEGTADGQMHNTLGDTCELLIKPEEQTWYWEFHVTPAGHKSCFFFPGRGRLCLPSCLAHRSAVRVAAYCDGTLNHWQDRDRGWSAEMAIPVSELCMEGETFEPGARWRVLIGRYNYSRYLRTRGPELTAAPAISRADFHCFEEYALLDLVR